MESKKLVLIINGQRQESYEIDAFEVSYGLYEETDIAVILHTTQENLVAEGVGRPSPKGIHEEPLEDTALMNTSFANKFMELRHKYFSKVLSEVTPGFSFIEKKTIFSKPYLESEMLTALEEFVAFEERMASLYYIKIIKEPYIRFTNGSLIISEDVELYSDKSLLIEDAKVEEVK